MMVSGRLSSVGRHDDLDLVPVRVEQASAVLAAPVDGCCAGLGNGLAAVLETGLVRGSDRRDALRRERDLAEPGSLRVLAGDEERGLGQAPADRVRAVRLPPPAERGEDGVVEAP